VVSAVDGRTTAAGIALALVGQADHRRLEHGRVALEHLLHLDRVDR
jgi:hypothetical protein